MGMLVDMFTNGPGALFNWCITGIVLYGAVRSVLIKTGTMASTSLIPVTYSLLTGLLGFFAGGRAVLGSLNSIPQPHRAAALWIGLSTNLYILQHAALCGIILYALYATDTRILNRRNNDAITA